jgi:hypothetical protein
MFCKALAGRMAGTKRKDEQIDKKGVPFRERLPNLKQP